MEPSEPIKQPITAAAAAAFPNEAIGLVIEPAGAPGTEEFLECQNIHHKPRKHFEYLKSDWDAAEARGKILYMWHTHPNALANPCWDDMATSEAWDLPVVVYATPADQWRSYAPEGWIAPLYDRPFVYGVLDCRTLVIDYFKTELGIDIPYQYYPENWWVHKRDDAGNLIERAPELMVESVESSGFVFIDRSDIRKYDVPLMRVTDGAVCHCGVYLGDGQLLHHFADQKSRKVSYRINVPFYGTATEYVVRHQSLT
jgi:proteasome lid subunit RPN8/RPN11